MYVLRIAMAFGNAGEGIAGGEVKGAYCSTSLVIRRRCKGITMSANYYLRVSSVTRR